MMWDGDGYIFMPIFLMFVFVFSFSIGRSFANNSSETYQYSDVVCTECGEINSWDSVFCKECGAWFGTKCPNCGAEIDDSYCSKCGLDLSDYIE